MMISKRPSAFKRLSGVSQETFKKMVEIVKQADYNRLKWETRGRDNELSYEDQVLLSLLYLRAYTTYFYLWAVFNTSESTAFRMSRKVENALIKCWMFNLPKKTILQEDLETIIIDATEVWIQRPKHKQKKYYSGKKKKHTLKAQIVIKQNWHILRTNFTNGKTHDKKLYDESKLKINKNINQKVDSGYQWIQETKKNITLPYKSSKKKKLTKEQKKFNKELSSKRIKVENKLCEIKCFRIFDYKYRNRKTRFWLRFNLICWIINHEHWFGKN
jgi:hypothetical protein